MVGDFNGDGRSDIVHAVQDTDDVIVWDSLYAGSHSGTGRTEGANSVIGLSTPQRLQSDTSRRFRRFWRE
jgi:hypothetical protein